MRPAESFVAQPIRSLQTMLRVISQDDPFLPTVIPDGIYGPKTSNAVAAFQRKYELPVTGITDQNTWERIVEIYEPAWIRISPAEPIEVIMDPGQVFRTGDANPMIYLLQAILLQMSLHHSLINAPDVTGIYDEPTSKAVAAFQKLAGLEESGDLDKITWKHIARQYALNAHHRVAE